MVSILENISQDDQSQLDSQTFDSFQSQGLELEEFQDSPVDGLGDIKRSNLSKLHAVGSGIEAGLGIASGVSQIAKQRKGIRESHQQALENIFRDKKRFDEQKRIARRQEDLAKFQQDGAMLLDSMIRDMEKSKAQSARVSNAIQSLNQQMQSNQSFRDAIRQFASQRQEG